MAIEDRLDRLERELSRSRKRFRWLILGAGLGLLSAAVLYASRDHSDAAKVGQELRATSFILEDANGKPRASLGLDEDGLELRLRYENDNIGAALCLHEDKVVLSFADKVGKPRAVLGLTKNVPLLCLYDEKEEPRVTVALLQDGPHLVLRDEKGNALPIK